MDKTITPTATCPAWTDTPEHETLDPTAPSEREIVHDAVAAVQCVYAESHRWTGKSIAVVARDLGVHEGTLGDWVAQDRDAGRAGSAGVSCPATMSRSSIACGARTMSCGWSDQRTKERVPHTRTCVLLGVSVSWFYKWITRVESADGLHTGSGRVSTMLPPRRSSPRWNGKCCRAIVSVILFMRRLRLSTGATPSAIANVGTVPPTGYRPSTTRSGNPRPRRKRHRKPSAISGEPQSRPW